MRISITCSRDIITQYLETISTALSEPAKDGTLRWAINSFLDSLFASTLRGELAQGRYFVTLRKCSLALALIINLVTLLNACGGLPRDFESLPLEEKIEAYSRHLNTGGQPMMHARWEIAWHGWDAAELVAQYLSNEKGALPPFEVIYIISFIQEGGCPLKDSVAEVALKNYVNNVSPESLEEKFGKSTLESIRNNYVSTGSDAFSDGPCAEFQRRRLTSASDNINW